MKKHMRTIVLMGIAIFLGFAAYLVPFGTTYHYFFVHGQFIFIVLIIMLKQKRILPILLVLITGHIIADYLASGIVPLQTITESFVQFLTALILYTLLQQREKQSKRYENFIESTKIGTWEWNVQTGACSFNEYWANICGYTLDELKPLSIKTWQKLSHPDDLLESENKLKKMFQKETDYYEHQVRMRHKDGHWVWVLDHGKVMTWTDDQQPLIVAGTHIDVTREIDMKNNIQYVRDLMAYIVENANAAVAVHDLNLNYIYVSKKYCEAYQVEYENIIGKHHYEVFPDLPQKWRDVHQRVLKGEIISDDRDPYQRMDGHTDYTRWECRPWYEQDGKIGGLIVYTEVINDQIERELELEKSKQTLQDIMDSLPIGIASHDLSSNLDFEYMNDVYPEFYGTTKELIEEKGFWEAVYEDPEFRDEIRKRVVDDIQNYDGNRLEWLDIPLKREGQPTRYVSSFATKIHKTGKMVSTVIDVTDRILREEEIRKFGYTDSLLNIPNRLFFTDQFKTLDKGNLLPLTVIVMDINGLKIINDAFGMEKGNDALKQVAHMLIQIKRENDVIARIGGDEFAMLLSNTNQDELDAIKSTLHELSKTLKIQDVSYSLAIGVSTKNDLKTDLYDTLKQAEEDMYRKKVLEGQSIRNRAILSILSMLTDKYDEERIHSERVSQYCMKIGENLKLNADELEELKMAGMLHDIGKIAIPDSILDKPGKLTDEEWIIMKQHTLYGYNILKAADEYSNLATYALTHHEKFDGTGYPQGIKGKKIPLYSRIISVVDAYEAMTSDRVYRKAMDQQDAIDELTRWSGKQFDPEIVDIFIHQAL
ncbi:MAG: HD domain-containing phosphohydrolase [Acholeplasmataceae bacterium]|nr:PAS domain S-box protein [Acholeplasmataceae bacterium]